MKFPLTLHSLHNLFSVLEQTRSNEVICGKVRGIYGQGSFGGQFH